MTYSTTADYVKALGVLLKKRWDKSDLFTVVVNVTDEMVGFLGSIIVEANKKCFYSKGWTEVKKGQSLSLDKSAGGYSKATDTVIKNAMSAQGVSPEKVVN